MKCVSRYRSCAASKLEANQAKIGRALVAVPAALNYQAQVIVARKVHGLSNILGISCRDCVNTWFGRPRVDPSQGLREPGLIADEIWISQIVGEKLARLFT